MIKRMRIRIMLAVAFCFICVSAFYMEALANEPDQASVHEEGVTEVTAYVLPPGPSEPPGPLKDNMKEQKVSEWDDVKTGDSALLIGVTVMWIVSAIVLLLRERKKWRSA